MSQTDVDEQAAREAARGALAMKLSTATIDSSVATKQPIYTVPAGKQYVPFFIVLRPSNVAWDEVGGFLHIGLGDISASGEWIVEPSGGSVIFGTAMILSRLSDGGSNAANIGNAGDVLGALFTAPEELGTIDIDLFGYLIDAPE